MSDVGVEGRSFKRITQADLQRLSDLAAADCAAFFASHPEWAVQYEGRVLAMALCQGAALHVLDGKTGIQDFDVYTFYARHPDRPWYAKRLKSVDFGDPKFGTSLDRPEFKGRRVDLMGRSLDVTVDCDPILAIRQWLRKGREGSSAALLAKKAVILVSPIDRIGAVIWPEGVNVTIP
jgi:hypothetical protein